MKSLVMLLAFLLAPLSVHALDYQKELDLLQKVDDDLHNPNLTRDMVEKLAIVYISQYHARLKDAKAAAAAAVKACVEKTKNEKSCEHSGDAFLPEGKTGDRFLYAFDEFYHEKLEYYLQTYVKDIVKIPLESPSEQDILQLAAFHIKVAEAKP